MFLNTSHWERGAGLICFTKASDGGCDLLKHWTFSMKLKEKKLNDIDLTMDHIDWLKPWP